MLTDCHVVMQCLRILLQQGVQPSWFSPVAASMDEGDVMRSPGQSQGIRGGDLRHYLLETSNPVLGETVFAEVLLKALEPYRKAGETCCRPDNYLLRTLIC